MTEAIKALSFEEALITLNQTLEKLEAGELPLNEAIDLYEKGMALSQHCQAQLDAAALRVKRLTETGALVDA